MSEPLQDFVARYEWRFVPSARDAATDIQGEVVGGAPARGTRAGNDGYVLLYLPILFFMDVAYSKDSGLEDYCQKFVLRIQGLLRKLY